MTSVVVSDGARYRERLFFEQGYAGSRQPLQRVHFHQRQLVTIAQTAEEPSGSNESGDRIHHGSESR